jgi:hypothetical protein
VFEDIAATVCAAIASLGHTCAVVDCPSLLSCSVSYQQLVVLGAHNLANYVDAETGELAAAAALPPDAVLYNFEHVGEGGVNTNARGAGVPLAKMFGRFSSVWDYSRRNVEVLREHGVPVLYVPLGSPPPMSPPSSALPGTTPPAAIEAAAAAAKDIDVLFFGHYNGTGRVIAHPLRSHLSADRCRDVT